MRPEMAKAASLDLGRSIPQCDLLDATGVHSFAKSELASIDKYVKDVPVETELLLGPAKSFVRYEPLGVALIYGTWNYPILLTMKPLIQAITAGNCAMIKPSEMAPETAAVMNKLITNYLDPECFKVIEGGAEVSQAIG